MKIIRALEDIATKLAKQVVLLDHPSFTTDSIVIEYRVIQICIHGMSVLILILFLMLHLIGG